MAIYLKIDGVQGNVTTTEYQGCIEVLSYAGGSSKSVTQKTGAAGDRSVGPVQFDPVVFNKPLDMATVDLLQYHYENKVIPEVTFYHVSTGSPAQCYVKNVFKNVLIGRIAELFGQSGVNEEVTFHFTAHQKTVQSMTAANKTGTPQVVGFNAETARTM